jgi:hypothetical protein
MSENVGMVAQIGSFEKAVAGGYQSGPRRFSPSPRYTSSSIHNAMQFRGVVRGVNREFPAG